MTLPDLINRKKTTAASYFTIQSMDTTQESVVTEDGVRGGHLRGRNCPLAGDMLSLERTSR